MTKRKTINTKTPEISKDTVGLCSNKYKTLQAIVGVMRSNPQTNKLTENLILATIEEIKSRCHTEEQEQNRGQKNITGMDAYYIPSMFIKGLTDNDLLEILEGILCRPEHFGYDTKLQEWTISNNGLCRLNYILNQAAVHTMRQLEDAKTKHSKRYLNKAKTKDKHIGIWLPEQEQDNSKDTELIRPGFLYFKKRFKDWSYTIKSDKDQKIKIFFNIKSINDYLNFVRSLLSTKIEKNEHGYIDKNPEEKPFWLSQIDGLFMKNIIAFSDMERNDAYTSKRTFFPQILREIFFPFFQIVDNNTRGYTEELENHENEFSRDFTIHAYGKALTGKFILSTKSQTSLLDKTRRDPKYSTSTEIKDLIRGTIIMDNQDDLILMMHYFAKYFIKNPEGNFDHSTYNETTHERGLERNGFNPLGGLLRNLKIYDKGILTNINQIKNIVPGGTRPSHGTALEKLNNSELDYVASRYLVNTDKHVNNRKATTSNTYIDTKYIIPINIRQNLLSIELQFITNENAERNNQGINDHRIMRLKQKIQLQCRDQKFIDEYKIRREVNQLLEDKDFRKKVQEDLNAIGNNESPENFIYRDIINGLVSLEYGEREDGTTIEGFCSKKIHDNLSEGGYFPTADQIRIRSLTDNLLFNNKDLRKEIKELIKTIGKLKEFSGQFLGNGSPEDFLYIIYINRNFRIKIQKYIEKNGNNPEILHDIMSKYFPTADQIRIRSVTDNLLLNNKDLRKEIKELIKTIGKLKEFSGQFLGNGSPEDFLYIIYINRNFRIKIQKYIEKNGNNPEILHDIITKL